jgi:hypothetical protein
MRLHDTCGWQAGTQQVPINYHHKSEHSIQTNYRGTLNSTRMVLIKIFVSIIIFFSPHSIRMCTVRCYIVPITRSPQLRESVRVTVTGAPESRTPEDDKGYTATYIIPGLFQVLR